MLMENGFTKGLIIGGIVIGAVSMAVSSDLMSSRGRRKAMKSGRRFLRRSGSVMNDVAGVFR